MRRAWDASPGSIALTAATAKTVINVLGGAAEVPELEEIHVSWDASLTMLIELCESTQATTGTSTDFTASLKQIRGFIAAGETDPAQITVRSNYTAEPTALTMLRSWWAQSSPFVLQYPLGHGQQGLTSAASIFEGLALRLTAPSGCNCRPTLTFGPA